jgi:hypothetical protein
MSLPNDPIILLSFVNTALRDKYPSFEEMCEDMDIDGSDVTEKLRNAGFEYNKELNKFQ